MAGRKKVRLDASDLELFQITDNLPTVYQAALHLRVLTTRYKNRLVPPSMNKLSIQFFETYLYILHYIPTVTYMIVKCSFHFPSLSRTTAVHAYAEALVNLWRQGFGQEHCKSMWAVKLILNAILDDYAKERGKQ